MSVQNSIPTPAPVAYEPAPDDGALAVAATFTAEPLEPSLGYLLRLFALSLRPVFAPYHQVLQQLLDPGSVLGRNRRGATLILIRLCDFLRDRDVLTTSEEFDAFLWGVVADLSRALEDFAQRSALPVVLGFPPHAAESAGLHHTRLLAETERLQQQFADRPQFTVLRGAAWNDPGPEIFDRVQDRLAHVPYTAQFFATLSLLVARQVHASSRPAHKVLVLDCDNTLWRGVVGEVGAQGIELLPGHRALQDWARSLAETGVLVCLCSKNADADVVSAFEQRAEFPLQLGHVVARRVNWNRKSQNLVELARELNLGLDSFVFVDDNPVECAEVRAALPEVLTLQAPQEPLLGEWVQHVWAFDRVRVTEEDRRRATMYQQEVQRKQFESAASSIEEFLAALELQVDSAEPSAEEMPRVAQLTQRTDQFNSSTRRRQALLEAGNQPSTGLIVLRDGEPHRPAIFLVHDGDGETLLYRNLAQRLAPGIAVYGIPPRTAPGIPLAATSVEAMATEYVTRIRRVRTSGPRFVGGMCAGGTIALEMARQLELSGEDVQGVFVLDAAAPRARRRRGIVAGRRWIRFSAALRSAGGPKGVGRAVALAGRKAGSVVRYELSHGWEQRRDQILFQWLERCLAGGHAWSERLPAWTVRRIYDLAEQEHEPGPLLRTPVLLARALGGAGSDEGYRRRYEDDDLGWGHHIKADLQVVDVQGGHASMLQEPWVDDLAQRMAQRIEEEQAVRQQPAQVGLRLLVAIVNYRAARFVCPCLDSLAGEVAELGNTRVVVIDNPGDTDDADQIEQHIRARGYGAWCQLQRAAHNGGFAFGCNVAIRPDYSSHAPAQYYLLLNPDTVVKPGALRELVDFMDQHPAAGIAGSRLLNPDGSPARSVFRFPSVWSELDNGLRLGLVSRLLKDYVVAPVVPQGVTRTDWVSGACMIVRRQVLDDTGLLDEDYFLYYEELDLCLRAQRSGWSCYYVPTSEVVHWEGQSTGVTDPALRTRRLPAYWFESRQRFFRKNYGAEYALAADGAWLLGHAGHRLRCALEGKASGARDSQARDLLRHVLTRSGGARSAAHQRISGG